MIPKLRNISYEMRLKESGLTTLETRRLRGDQIEVFKILNGYEHIDRNIFFTVKEERRTRGHGVTLAKKQCRLDIRKFSFSHLFISSSMCHVCLFQALAIMALQTGRSFVVLNRSVMLIPFHVDRLSIILLAGVLLVLSLQSFKLLLFNSWCTLCISCNYILIIICFCSLPRTSLNCCFYFLSTKLSLFFVKTSFRLLRW
jgi:hypothetical protein